jgi:hypothetical protein
MMNNLSDVQFPLKHQTLPFLGITKLPSEGRQQIYRFLERSVSKPVLYRVYQNVYAS